MPTATERRLDRLVHELSAIKKEMILQKIQQVAATAGKINTWESLSERISARWDHVPAVEEIRQQRDRV